MSRDPSAGLPEALQPYARELERVGLRDVLSLWGEFAATAGLASADHFLAWLQGKGLLDAKQLRDIHRRSRAGRIERPTLDLLETGSAPVEQRYEFLGKISGGAMGEVYLARDPVLERNVAVKIVAGAYARQGEILQRFIVEAKVTAQLEHPGIVTVYGMEHSELGNPAYVMKLIRGMTLREYIDEALRRQLAGEDDPEYALDQRLEHFLKLCDAMAYAHERGVIHRDLKPQNIMVGGFNDVYVMDWGLAKTGFGAPGRRSLLGDLDTVDVRNDHTPTDFGQAVGTPAYMSPEQANGQRELTPPSDQYAMGLILFELLCLKRAIPSGGASDTLAHARRGFMQPLESSSGPPVDTALAAIVARATMRDPDERYPDLRALAADLRRHLRHEEVDALPDRPARALWRWVEHHPTLSAAAAFAVVFAVGTTAMVHLARSFVSERDHAQEQERVTERMGAVTRQSHAIDRQLQRHLSLLDGVAESARHLRRTGLRTPGPVYRRVQGRVSDIPPDHGPVAGYPDSVSLVAGSWLVAPGTSWVGVQREIRSLLPLSEHLRRALVRSVEEDLGVWSADHARSLLSSGRVAPSWLYVGLESGALLTYPGVHDLPEELDPRTQPWYQATRGTYGPRWGLPYDDPRGAGVSLPCTVALYDAAGAAFGVAGLDLPRSALVKLLEPVELREEGNAYLLDREGAVLATTASTPSGSELALFPDEAVRQAVSLGVPYGYDVRNDGVIVFSRVPAAGWTYAVVLSEAELAAP